MALRAVSDQYWMVLALQQAKRGTGQVAPNPLVGAVVVKNGRLLATGHHRAFGAAHAEAAVLQKLTPWQTRGATLYVTLEPCVHQGKMPPCLPLILATGIKRVVIGSKDSNPLVAGRGIRALRRSGVAVTVGVLLADCRKLNRSFFCAHELGRPWVTIKIAQTLDGYVADAVGNSRWITGLPARRLAHQLRATHDAILVGAGTVVADNPRLNVRHVKGRNPLRVVIDPQLRTSVIAAVYNRTAPTLLVHTKHVPAKERRFTRRGVTLLRLPILAHGHMDFRSVLEALLQRGINSVLVEGGPTTWSIFLQQHLVDEVYIAMSPRVFGAGTKAFNDCAKFDLRHAPTLFDTSLQHVGDDLLFHGFLRSLW